MIACVATDRTAWLQGRMTVGGRSLFYRRSVGGEPDGVPIVHVHGFAISGAYLMPTARLLAGRWVNVVPDLPGYGRSGRLTARPATVGWWPWPSGSARERQSSLPARSP